MNVILGGFCTFVYAMTIPIYFNLGGEITFPTGEAHSTARDPSTEGNGRKGPLN